MSSARSTNHNGVKPSKRSPPTSFEKHIWWGCCQHIWPNKVCGGINFHSPRLRFDLDFTIHASWPNLCARFSFGGIIGKGSTEHKAAAQPFFLHTPPSLYLSTFQLDLFCLFSSLVASAAACIIEQLQLFLPQQIVIGRHFKIGENFVLNFEENGHDLDFSGRAFFSRKLLSLVKIDSSPFRKGKKSFPLRCSPITTFSPVIRRFFDVRSFSFFGVLKHLQSDFFFQKKMMFRERELTSIIRIRVGHRRKWSAF